jgi:hypothetical protein
MSSHIFTISRGLGVFVSFTIGLSVYCFVGNLVNNETMSNRATAMPKMKHLVSISISLQVSVCFSVSELTHTVAT